MSQPHRYFITATGTGQGKTLVTTALCWQLRQSQRAVSALKPVISGYDAAERTDTTEIIQSLGLPVEQHIIDAVSPWRFETPISPDFAAAMEDKKLSLQEILNFCNKTDPAKEQPSPAPVQLIEGAGGLMSPLTSEHTNLDMLAALQCPAILVSASYLGCISHILTALTVLELKAIPIAALILSEAPVENAQRVETVLTSLLPQLPKDLPVETIKALDGGAELWKTVPKFTQIQELLPENA